MIETIILCSINVITLLIGVKIGSYVKKDITINPIKAIQEHKEEKQEKKEAELKERQIETMLKNIDNYDGTEFGQQQIPR